MKVSGQSLYIPSMILGRTQPGTGHTWLQLCGSVYWDSTTLCYQTGPYSHRELGVSETVTDLGGEEFMIYKKQGFEHYLVWFLLVQV